MTVKAPHKKSGYRLRVFLDEKTGEINIEGNKAGLEYLAEACLAIIGQPPGPNHWHLSEAFDTLDPQSPDLIISHRDDLE